MLLLRPKLIPLLLENTILLRLKEVFDAETLMLVRLVAMEAVSVPLLSPKDTPFEFEKVKEFTAVLVLLAEMVTAWLAVTTEAAPTPKLTPLLLLKMTVGRAEIFAPAEMLTAGL